MGEEILIYGLHAVRFALLHNASNVAELWIDVRRNDARVNELLELAGRHRVRVQSVSRDELDRRVGQSRHQGVVAQCRQPPSYHEHDLPQLLEESDTPPLLLILDGVTDPHNLGACLRTADAAGAHAVIAPRDRAAGLNATVRKVACGAAEHVPFIQATNLARTLRELKDMGIWLVGTAGEASQALYSADLRGPVGIVMGGEGKGMRRLTRDHCDLLVNIPLLGRVESLNVSVAAGVCLYEAVRQRQPVSQAG